MKTLIFSPHLDDEILGCFTCISNETHIVYCGSDESRITNNWVKKRPNIEQRLNELKSVQENLGFEYTILDNRVNEYQVYDLIHQFERSINVHKPNEVYIPVPSYNQDHRAVYEAALTALRPHDINHFVKNVFIYEQVQDLWNHNYHVFNPTHFKPLDIKKKIAAYNLYKSQVRSFRSPEMITSLASIRGTQSNLQFAEAFEVIRYVQS